MNQQINESDYLEQPDETKYLKVLENIISSKKEGIDDDESQALIKVRKEFIRRNMSI